ncbi:hypothetical protein [Amycolatopsis sp. NPDC051372]|uniref:hypothetical protein n=1 Tax=Amycolatopsis sp. NPDC051372 TaxID=3155669 RepID=UPI00342348F8
MTARPRNGAQWTVAASGALALTMGVAGLLAPSRQVSLMSFDGTEGSAKTAAPLLTVSSLAAVNTGLLYLLGAPGIGPAFPRSPCAPGS